MFAFYCNFDKRVLAMETKVIALHLHHHNMAHLQELVNALPKVGVGQSNKLCASPPFKTVVDSQNAILGIGKDVQRLIQGCQVDCANESSQLSSWNGVSLCSAVQQCFAHRRGQTRRQFPFGLREWSLGRLAAWLSFRQATSVFFLLAEA